MKKLTGVVLLILLAVGGLMAQDFSEPELTLSFDSGYIPYMNSNRGIRHFNLEVTKAVTWGDVQLAQWAAYNLSPTWGALARTAYFYLLYGYALTPFTTAFHEFGHYSRSRAFGYDAYMIHGHDVDGTRHDNYWSYLTSGFTSFSSWGAGLAGISGGTMGQDVPDTLKRDDNAWIIVSAGGLNNEMSLSEAIGDDLFYRGGYSGYFWPYLAGKTSTANYISAFRSTDELTGDPDQLVDYYKAKGYDISKTKMMWMSYGSALLSATTYNLLWNFFTPGDPARRVNTFEVAGIRLPDTEFYMNYAGLSYKFKTGLALRDQGIFIPVNYEQVFYGDPMGEISGGAVVMMPEGLTVGGLLLMNLSNLGLGASLFGEYTVQRYRISAGTDLHHTLTLEGARNATTYEAGLYSVEIWGRVSYMLSGVY